MAEFLWDGSDLGDISDRFVNFTTSSDHLGLFLYIRPNIVCLGFKYKTSLPLIIDEAKVLFGLPKLGRHICKINGKRIMLQKLEYYSEKCVKVNIEDVTIYQKRQIQRFIGFRYLLSIPFRNCLSFWFRESEGYISYYEISLNLEDNIFPTSSPIQKWFSEENSFDETIINVLSISPYYRKSSSNEKNNLFETLEVIKTKLSEIIKRIDVNYLTLASEFQHRAGSKIYD